MLIFLWILWIGCLFWSLPFAVYAHGSCKRSSHKNHRKRSGQARLYKSITSLFPIPFANIQFNIIRRLIRGYNDRLQLECGILGPCPDTFRKLALNFHSSGINSLSHLCKYFLQDFLLAFKHHLWHLGLAEDLNFYVVKVLWFVLYDLLLLSVWYPWENCMRSIVSIAW